MPYRYLTSAETSTAVGRSTDWVLKTLRGSLQWASGRHILVRQDTVTNLSEYAKRRPSETFAEWCSSNRRNRPSIRYASGNTELTRVAVSRRHRKTPAADSFLVTELEDVKRRLERIEKANQRAATPAGAIEGREKIVSIDRGKVERHIQQYIYRRWSEAAPDEIRRRLNEQVHVRLEREFLRRVGGRDVERYRGMISDESFPDYLDRCGALREYLELLPELFVVLDNQRFDIGNECGDQRELGL